MLQPEAFDNFINKVIGIISQQPDMKGLAVAGSHITKETDTFSDLDLILVSESSFSDNPTRMKALAAEFGQLLGAFTGEHVGEPRVLICLYDSPLMHVDLKFLKPHEFHIRVEDPVVVWERESVLTGIISGSQSAWPYPDYQWIEDRFWVWIHYAALKLGRGELFETLDFISFLRTTVLGPLLLIKNGHQPRGVRKLETKLSVEDITAINQTVSTLDKYALINALQQCIYIYEDLRIVLFDNNVDLRQDAANRAKEYLQWIKQTT